MSCGSRKQMGSFSSQKNTWSPQTSLSMSNWEPYPELQNPKNLYGSNTVCEKYCSSSGCDLYRVESAPITNSSTPILERSVIVAGRSFRESYERGAKCQSYMTVNDTWGVQKPYMA